MKELRKDGKVRQQVLATVERKASCQLGAACVFIALPILVFVLLVQKHFVRGLTMGMMRERNNGGNG